MANTKTGTLDVAHLAKLAHHHAVESIHGHLMQQKAGKSRSFDISGPRRAEFDKQARQHLASQQISKADRKQSVKAKPAGSIKASAQKTKWGVKLPSDN